MRELEERVEHLSADVDALKRALFGRKSEKMPPMEREVRRGQKADPAETRRLRKERAVGKEKLVTEEVKLPIPDKERCCPHCQDGEMRAVGQGKKSIVYEYIPGYSRRVVYARETLACTCGDYIVTAPCADKTTDNTRYAPSFVAHLIVSKCSDSIPLYRLEKQYQRVGVPIARSTMTDLFHRHAEMLAPLAKRLIAIVKASDIVLADETTIRMQGTLKRAYLWTFIADRTITYVFSKSRSGETPVEALGGSKGTLLVDAYTGYNQVTLAEGRTRAGCLAHVRRKFFDAREASPVAETVLTIIRDIYVVEHEIKARELVGTQEHLALRRTRTRPLLAKLFHLLRKERGRHPPKTPMGKAVQYALKNHRALTRFTGDPRIPPDNNRSEAALRIVAIYGSLCTSSSSTRNHEIPVVARNATRAPPQYPAMSNGLFHFRPLEICSLDLPRSVLHHLPGGQDAGLDQLPNQVARDTDLVCRLQHRETSTILDCGLVAGDAGGASVGFHAKLGPGLPLTGSLAHAIERGRDVSVRPASRHVANHAIGFSGGAFRVLPGLRLAHAKLRVLPAAPMDHEYDISGLVVDINDDLVNQSSDESLLGPHLRRRRSPHPLKVGGQSQESLLGDFRNFLSRGSRKACFALPETRQCRVPPSLELGGDQPIVRIHRLVTPRRELDLVLGLLLLEFESTPPFVDLLGCVTPGHEGSFHRGRLDRKQDLLGDDIVRATGAEGDTRSEAVHRVALTATVARLRDAASAIGDLQHAPAATTPEDARHQRGTATSRLRSARPLAVRVPRETRLDLLELLPGDVRFVVIAQERSPRFHATRATITLAHDTVNNGCLNGRFAICICAGVERILKNGDDVSINWFPPRDRLQVLAVGWAWELEFFGPHV